MTGVGSNIVRTTESEMLQLLRESLLPNPHMHNGRMSSRAFAALSKSRGYVALDGFDEFDSAAALHQSRRKSRSRALIKDHRTGAGIVNVIVCADECVYQLQQVTNRLAIIASRNEQLAKGEKVSDPGQKFSQLAELAQQLMLLSRETFVPAHRLCSSAIGLYMTEDFIREPRDLDCEDYFSHGRIQVPNQDSQKKTMEKLQVCVKKAETCCAKFQPVVPFMSERKKGSAAAASQLTTEYEEMWDVLLIMRNSILNLYSTTKGCFHLFGLLLYINPEQQRTLTGFLNDLTSMEKSDLLEDISTLRRSVDHFPILLEKLSWASYTVFRLASGKSVSPSPVESGIDTPNGVTFSQPNRNLDSLVKQKILAQKSRTDRSRSYERGMSGKSGNSKEKRSARGGSVSERDLHGRSMSRSKGINQAKAVDSMSRHPSQTHLKLKSVKSKSKERLSERDRKKSKSKEKKAKKQAKKDALKKFKNSVDVESQDELEYE